MKVLVKAYYFILSIPITEFTPAVDNNVLTTILLMPAIQYITIIITYNLYQPLATLARLILIHFLKIYHGFKQITDNKASINRTGK